MYCAHCSEKILGDSVQQGAELFCSYECASLASGLELDEENEYFEEDSVEDFFEDYDE